ncbi:MAG: glycosyltransferase family 9 protein [Candidatus Kapaibacteriota bacterium]|jgi:ADP-heptose:LPS heptosyltransferase
MKILLLRQDRLGDLLISTGIIRNLRKIIPKAEIHLLLGTKNYFANHIVSNYIDKFYLYDKKLFNSIKLISNLRNEKYDYVIDLFDNSSKTSELLIKLINAKTSVGLDKSNSHLYNNVIELKPKSTTHIIDRVANLLEMFSSQESLNKMDFSPEYNFKTNYDISNLLQFDNENKILLINLFGSNESKFWGVENHINLINKIITESNFNILISTTKDRKETLDQIIFKIIDFDKFEGNRIKLVPFNNDLDYISTVISKVDLVLTPDTSIVHISAAFKVKCTILYPDTEEKYGGKYWTPYNSPYITLNAINGDLKSIKIDDVFKAINN